MQMILPSPQTPGLPVLQAIMTSSTTPLQSSSNPLQLSGLGTHPPEDVDEAEEDAADEAVASLDEADDPDDAAEDDTEEPPFPPAPLVLPPVPIEAPNKSEPALSKLHAVADAHITTAVAEANTTPWTETEPKRRGFIPKMYREMRAPQKNFRPRLASDEPHTGQHQGEPEHPRPRQGLTQTDGRDEKSDHGVARRKAHHLRSIAPRKRVHERDRSDAGRCCGAHRPTQSTRIPYERATASSEQGVVKRQPKHRDHDVHDLHLGRRKRAQRELVADAPKAPRHGCEHDGRPRRTHRRLILDRASKS